MQIKLMTIPAPINPTGCIVGPAAKFKGGGFIPSIGLKLKPVAIGWRTL